MNMKNNFKSIIKIRSRLNSSVIGILLSALTAVALNANSTCKATGMYPITGLDDWSSGLKSSSGPSVVLGLNINDQFVRYVDGELAPGLVREILKDNETGQVTLLLDQTCKWSNGKSINSQDVRAGIEAAFMKEASHHTPRKGLFPNGELVIEGKLAVSELGIDTPDDWTLTFQSDLNLSNINFMFAHPSYAPKPSWLLEEDPDLAFSPEPADVFSGPYKVVEWVENQKIELVANEYFCGQKPFYKSATVINGSSAEDFIKATSSGQDISTFFTYIPREYQKGILSLPSLKDKYFQENFGKANVAFFRLNETTGPLQDPLIRRAFSLAIDWDGPAGLKKRLISARRHLHSVDSLLPNGYVENAPSHNKDQRPREERLNEARSLLVDAGFTDASPLVLKAALGNSMEHYFYPIKEMVEAGLPVQINETVFGADDTFRYFQEVHLSDHTEYDISLADWGWSIKWPSFFLEFYFNNNTVSNEVKQAGAKFMDVIKTTPDPARALLEEQGAIQYLLDENIYIPVYTSSSVYLMSSDMKRRSRHYLPLLWDIEPVGAHNCLEN